MKRENPFTPGIAGSPPVLAGRDEELREVDELIDGIAAGKRIYQETILYGPRGNGKTTLLHKVTADLEKSTKVKPVFVQAPSITTPRQLYRKLRGESPPSQQTETSRLKGSLGISGTSVGGDLETSEVTDTSLVDLEERCAVAMNDEPTLLMVDEAHLITRETLNSVLALTDSARQKKTKMAVIFAGTPMLPAHIRRMDASYLNRTRRRRMERLDIESTKTALFQPLKNAGYAIQLTAEEENRAISWTQCYPHFIQSVGHALWDVVEGSGSGRVDAASLQNAQPLWESEMNLMYLDRLGELRDQRIASHARAIAEVFLGGKSEMYVDDIENVIVEDDPATDPVKVMNGLVALGYIWETEENSMEFEPGIPSLMDHVLSKVRARDRVDQ